MDTTDVTKACGNCTNLYLPDGQEPCNSCNETTLSKWAPNADLRSKAEREERWHLAQKQAFDGTEHRLDPKPAALPDDNPKTRFGVTKPSMACVPPGALIHLMRAMADGRRKYGLMNWREKTVSSTIYYDAAMRHLMSWLDGEEVASDSKVHHLGHVMACCAIILDAQANEKLNDDRPFKGAFAQLVAHFTEK